MEFKDTQEISFIRETLKKTMELRSQIQKEENKITDNLSKAVQAKVCSTFENFKNGDKVRVTYKSTNLGNAGTVTKELFFRNPTRMAHLNGTSACDYEIRFHAVKKDGTENKRDDLYENHIPVVYIESIEKI